VSIAVVTGSSGLIGGEAARRFARLGYDVVGIDNDMRSVFFGPDASTAWNAERLQNELGSRYRHHDLDIRERAGVLELFGRFREEIVLVVHAAAQPSHDWAATNAFTDFDINAVGTLNLLEATRRYAPAAVFIFCSTNKVYGDRPNELPLLELERRYEIDPAHPYANGIREDMSVDACMHSLFGVSKLAADVMVQEYGRYFQMRTACFRGGTLTGPGHSAAELHGFLAYLMRCVLTGTPYTVYGYKGKQVRDAIQSSDLIRAFELFFEHPRVAEVYNIGGGRLSNCSVVEAIELAQQIGRKRLDWSYTERNRTGDHIWWIGDNSRFQAHYPQWTIEYDVPDILREISEANRHRWSA
jgi:CDP-paratose 2-epimerase